MSEQQVQAQAQATKPLLGHRDPEMAELEDKMNSDINNMPAEVRDRFKALKVLYDQSNEIDHEEEKEYRQLELKYEKLYAEVYNKRRNLVTGNRDIDENLVKAFDERKQLRTADEKYAALEVELCDVNQIQNTLKGVSGFWLRSMLSNKLLTTTIMEKDRAILSYLIDIRLELHEHDDGFTLFFDFEPNSYFSNTTLTKKYHMSSSNIIEKCEGCEIKWTAGSDPTKMKKKKKQKKGGKKTNVTVTVKCDSFFNFFETIDANDEEQPKEEKDSDEEHEHGFGEKMDADLEIGTCFKDDLIPLALEYYLGIIEQESDDDCYGDEDDDDDKEKPPKKGKKSDEPLGAPGVGPDGQKQECKQQ